MQLKEHKIPCDDKNVDIRHTHTPNVTYVTLHWEIEITTPPLDVPRGVDLTQRRIPIPPSQR